MIVITREKQCYDTLSVLLGSNSVTVFLNLNVSTVTVLIAVFVLIHACLSDPSSVCASAKAVKVSQLTL